MAIARHFQDDLESDHKRPAIYKYISWRHLKKVGYVENMRMVLVVRCQASYKFGYLEMTRHQDCLTPSRLPPGILEGIVEPKGIMRFLRVTRDLVLQHHCARLQPYTYLPILQMRQCHSTTLKAVEERIFYTIIPNLRQNGISRFRRKHMRWMLEGAVWHL